MRQGKFFKIFHIFHKFFNFLTFRADFNDEKIQISEEMKKLLKLIFERDPNKRITAQKIAEYPWLNQ